MLRPAFAHFADIVLAVNIVILGAIYCADRIRRRKHDHRADKLTKPAIARWEYIIWAVGMTQLMAVLYSVAYDRPHETSIRTRVLILSGFIPILMRKLQIGSAEKLGKASQREERQKPYYAAEPGAAPASQLSAEPPQQAAAQWKGLRQIDATDLGGN